jgi:uncharacterized membrane protein
MSPPGRPKGEYRSAQHEGNPVSRKRGPARNPTRDDRTRDSPRALPGRQRYASIDALRGVSLCMMFVYHFSFDLRYYRVIGADFEHDPFWLGFRALIVSAFMALVGVSLVLADRAGTPVAQFWKRVGIITACALAVSVASWIMFPRTFIYFGILHSIAVASVLAHPLVRKPRVALAIGVAVIAAGIALSHPIFDAPWLSWIGFATTKPATEDYVPLAPWAGIVFVGIAGGYALVRGEMRALAPLNGAPRWLRWLGRHSLAVYMVHQPILLGVLWLVIGR